MASHESSSVTNEWFTPPEVFDAMGAQFTTDVASPGADIVPWIPASIHLTEASLETEWAGVVWMNPPFGGRNGYIPWVRKFLKHGNGVALAPNRTAAKWVQDFMAGAGSVFFWAPKIKFIRPDGTRGTSPGYGTILLSAGLIGKTILRNIDPTHGIYMEKLK